MHVLFIIDPLDSLFAYKDTSVSIMFSLFKRNHQISFCTQKDLFIDVNGKVTVNRYLLSLNKNANLYDNKWFSTSASSRDKINIFDAVLVRKDPPFDMEYFYMTHILEIAKKEGVMVVNDPLSLRNYSEKLSILNFPEFIAPTLVSSNIDEIKKFCFEYHDVILKPLDGMGGTGIFRLQEGDSNLNVILELSTDHGHRTVMLQRYISDISKGDKRVILINNELVPFCLARIPKKGENRGNLAVGGYGVSQSLSDNDVLIGKKVASFFSSSGLYIIGLDIIGNYLTEINVTSPTCFVEISNQTKFDVSDMLVDFLESTI